MSLTNEQLLSCKGVTINWKTVWLLGGKKVTRKVNAAVKAGVVKPTYYRGGASLSLVGNTSKTVFVRAVEEMPIPQPGDGGYILPNWRNWRVGHRATAMAYLQRKDGGEVVFYKGTKYQLIKPCVAC